MNQPEAKSQILQKLKYYEPVLMPSSPETNVLSQPFSVHVDTETVTQETGVCSLHVGRWYVMTLEENRLVLHCDI